MAAIIKYFLKEKHKNSLKKKTHTFLYQLKQKYIINDATYFYIHMKFERIKYVNLAVQYANIKF